MSRLGADALLSTEHLGDLLGRVEVDWKGDDEAFRIRHLFMRNRHWLVGQSWSSFNNISSVIQTIDSRFSGGAVGTRPVQIRYYDHFDRLTYQFSLEYLAPKLIQPDTLGAASTIVIPNVAGRLRVAPGPVELVVAGVYRTNQVHLADGRSQTLPAYGGLVAVTWELGSRNRLKGGVGGGSGTGGMLGDFAFVNIDMAYDGTNQRFENVEAYTGFVGFEHDWSNEFSTSVGWGFANVGKQDFFPTGAYETGSKALANVYYTPRDKWERLRMAVEVEYAERQNIDAPSNETTRASALIIFDF